MDKIMNDLKKVFLFPKNSTHRQYEALRAYFVDEQPAEKAAEKFGYSTGAFRVMCTKFRKNPQKDFFISRKRGPEKKAIKNNYKDEIIALRKQNLSVYDIAENLRSNGRRLTAPAISKILKEEGFSRLPRRADDERPLKKNIEKAAVADINKLDLSPQKFHTKFGGLFILLGIIAKIPFDEIIEKAKFPGTKMIPATQAVLSILALKLFGNARYSHVMSDVFDKGLGLFAGLNVIPKASFLAQYSSRITPKGEQAFVCDWFDAASELKYKHGTSFDLDFHTIPSHGNNELLQKHYISKRSRKQKGVLAFVANDTENRAFCYVNGSLRKEDMNNEILEFVEFWKTKNGAYPDELVFDSTFTTYEKLNVLNQLGIKFITLRARSSNVLDKVNVVPNAKWKRIKLENVTREYRTPKIIEDQISVKGYKGKLRQIAVRDLGHEYPTIVITNQLKRSPAKLIQRYARRMIIENNIADAIDFFHMDALSTTVALKVNFDLLMTLVGSTVYRIFAAKIGDGYDSAKFSRIFRDFISATADIEITEKDIIVKFQRRAHNPQLIASGLLDEQPEIPWLQNKRLKLILR
jgi:hypothetical protein